MRSPSLVLFSLLTACAAEPFDGSLTDDTEAPDDDGKVDSASELSVRAGDTTLWMNRTLARRGDSWYLHGRTSRTITDGNAYIFDDPYGDFAQSSARVFEVRFQESSGQVMADGVNLFTSLSFVHSSSRPDHLTVRTTVRPRVSSTEGPSSLALTAELTPVVANGKTYYRLKGRATKAISAIAPTMGTATQVDSTHYVVDLTWDELKNGQLAVTVTLPAGPVTITANIGMVVKKLGMTASDVEIVYPMPQCTAATKACLAALPDGALDLASCGEALNVRVCRGQIGSTINGADIAAAKTAADAKLVPFATDAVGLVGSTRAQELTNTVRNVIGGRLDELDGAWVLTSAARTALMSRAADLPIDDGYAFPLYFVDGFEPVPGDQAVTRQIAADAILSHLRQQDYLHSELGRTYLELTKVFRAQHVASLKNFREHAELVTFPTMPNVDYYVGDWIGLHAEVKIDHTTGEPTSVLVEID